MRYPCLRIPVWLLVAIMGLGIRTLPSLAQSAPFAWGEAQRLTQEQASLLSRIKASTVSPDPNQIRAVRGQLIVHLGALDRFLNRTPPHSVQICESPSASGGLSPQQRQVYCSLAASAQTLPSLLPELNDRLAMLATIAEVKPLPLVSGEYRPTILGDPVFVRGNLREPAKPLHAPAPELPREDPPIVGRTAKSPIALYRPPIQPAIAPPGDLVAQLQQLDTLVAQAQSAFPADVAFRDPEEVRESVDSLAFGMIPSEQGRYTQFLELPNTGVARVLPVSAYDPGPNVLRNRTLPTVLDRFPFAPLVISTASPPPQLADPLLTRLAPQQAQRFSFARLPETSKEAFIPRLALHMDQGTVRMVQSELDYGFLANVGDVPLESLTADLSSPRIQLSPQTRSFFIAYRPPKQLEALQVDRRRFVAGKEQAWGLQEPLRTEAPMQLNHTYVMRTLQFDLPDAVASGDRLDPEKRRYLPLLLDLQSQDLLVAFRPVRQRSDGSYTVLWKVLGTFPNPEIEDLATYVRL